MTKLIYDGTFEGLISAIFDYYALKLKDVKICQPNNETLDLFANKITCVYEVQKFERVRKRLIEILGKSGFNALFKATLSEKKGIENTILEVVKYTFTSEKNILKDFGHFAVLELNQILKNISRERHRMTAFVRFKLGKDGIYYTTVAPDFDVLPLLATHFKNRFADQKWLIFDTQRQYGIFYDLHQVQTVEFSQITEQPTTQSMPSSVHSIDWDEAEKEFQVLWKNYFIATNIKSRKNSKLHLQHVPKRYWKYLTEKEPN